MCTSAVVFLLDDQPPRIAFEVIIAIFSTVGNQWSGADCRPPRHFFADLQDRVRPVLMIVGDDRPDQRAAATKGEEWSLRERIAILLIERRRLRSLPGPDMGPSIL